MCDAVSLAWLAFGMSTATAVASHNAQAKTAEQQGEAIKRDIELKSMDSERQAGQMAQQSAEEMNAAARQAQADMAALDAIAQEYGGGNSVDRTRSIQSIQADEQLATIANNSRAGMLENVFQANAARERARSQMNAIRTPSRAATLLQIGSSAASSYGGYKNATKAPAGSKPE